MAKTKKVAIKDMTDEQIQGQLGVTNSLIHAGIVKWTNASNEERACPFNIFSHTGKVLIDRETDEIGRASCRERVSFGV